MKSVTPTAYDYITRSSSVSIHAAVVHGWEDRAYPQNPTMRERLEGDPGNVQLERMHIVHYLHDAKLLLQKCPNFASEGYRGYSLTAWTSEHVIVSNHRCGTDREESDLLFLDRNPPEQTMLLRWGTDLEVLFSASPSVAGRYVAPCGRTWVQRTGRNARTVYTATRKSKHGDLTTECSPDPQNAVSALVALLGTLAAPPNGKPIPAQERR